MVLLQQGGFLPQTGSCPLMDVDVAQGGRWVNVSLPWKFPPYFPLPSLGFLKTFLYSFLCLFAFFFMCPRLVTLLPCHRSCLLTLIPGAILVPGVFVDFLTNH